jgi:galactokinase
MPPINPTELRLRFQQRFGARPLLARAPGRVNLIGEHTDYNDGYVLPAAIDRYTWVAIAPRDDARLFVVSSSMAGERSIDLDTLSGECSGDWIDYVAGVALMLRREAQPLRGADILIDSDIPAGAGLSSSAALEVATALALLAVGGSHLDGLRLARACQNAENEVVGTQCGIMDQYASCFGQAETLLLLDCRTVEHRPIPLPPQATLLVFDSGVRHELASSEYNRRRADCSEAVEQLAVVQPHIRALRDATTKILDTHAARLSERVLHRARHVVGENERVLATVDTLQAADLETCGRLMFESHSSLRDDYEVSCAELDALVDIARRIPGVFGARMTGGGFGGCTVNLVDSARVDEIRDELAKRYAALGYTAGAGYVCKAVGGAALYDD